MLEIVVDREVVSYTILLMSNTKTIWMYLPSLRMEEFSKALATITKKAVKAGVPAPVVEFGTPTTEEGEVYLCGDPACAESPIRTSVSNRFSAYGVEKLEEGGSELVGDGWSEFTDCKHSTKGAIKLPVTYSNIPTVITYEKIKIEGDWNLVATIESAEADSMAKTLDDCIITAHGEVEIDRTSIPNNLLCQHCNMIRTRKTLYVLVSGVTGQQVTVGSTCLDSFLGQVGVAKALAKFADLVSEIESITFEFRSRMFSENVLMLVTTAYAWAAANTGGIYQKSQGWDGPWGTAKYAQAYLCGDRTIMEEIKKGRLVNPVITEEIATKAVFAVWWASELPVSNSEYMMNIRAAAKVGEVDDKHAGIACSIASSFDRECGKVVETLVRKKKEANPALMATSKEQAAPTGTRVKKAKLTVVTAFFLGAGDYGDRYLLKFVDEAGHSIVWFTGSKNGVEAGEIYEAAYTVKGSKEFKGQLDTQVSRVTLGEVIGKIDLEIEVEAK